MNDNDTDPPSPSVVCDIQHAYKGTEAVLWPIPPWILTDVAERGVSVVVQNEHNIWASEFRLLWLGQAGSRGNANAVVATLVVGQHQNKVTSLGLGNPHTRRWTTSDPSMLLPTNDNSSSNNNNNTWWFAAHPKERLLTCGVGSSPDRVSTRALFPLTGDEAQALAQNVACVGASNWELPVQLSLLGMGAAPSGYCAARHKFDLDGRLRPFPGNTIVCSIFEQTHPAQYQALVKAQTLLRNHPRLAPLYGFLPPSSFHMTVCELTSSTFSQSRFVPIDASWDQCHAVLKERLQPLLTTQSQQSQQTHRHSFVMKGSDNERKGYLVIPSLTTVVLQPKDGVSLRQLQDFRQQACELAGFDCNPNYVFHITLAYLLYHPVVGTEVWHEMAQVRTQMIECLQQAFTEGLVLQPQLTKFEDMGCFTPY